MFNRKKIRPLKGTVLMYVLCVCICSRMAVWNRRWKLYPGGLCPLAVQSEFLVILGTEIPAKLNALDEQTLTGDEDSPENQFCVAPWHLDFIL